MEPRGESDSLQRWWQEHSELDDLVAETAEALARGTSAAAASSLEDLAEAFEAHFEVEETNYFPLVERLSPEHRPALAAARLGHGKLRERLDGVRTLVADGDLHAARAALELLLDRFRTHEAEEAKLISRLEELSSTS